MKKRIKKFILISIVASEILLLNISPVLAVHIPSANEMASDIEKRYHLNTESIKNMGEGFNVSDTKTTAPQVMLFFNPTDPKPGEKITAQALPTYFSNQKESLYYTWYLKHDTGEETKEDSFGRKTKDGNTDYNDDGDIDIEDYKIEAMRIIANSDFDTKKASYESDSDNDNDGYHALWGGDDQDPKLTGFDNDYLVNGENDSNNNAFCYIHDFRSGEDYELNTASKVNFDCSSGTARCVKNTTLTCPAEIDIDLDASSDSSSGEEGSDSSSSASATFSGSTFLEYSVCTDLGETPACNCTESGCTPECSSGTPVCATSLTEYECDTLPSPSSAASCPSPGITPTCSVDSGEPGPGTNLCRHLFPSYKGFDGDLHLDEGVDVSDVNLDGEKVGDGSFGWKEEAFWKTSPQDPDTADNGNMDEANAVGLGQYQFSWNYQGGDRVGVAVEGVSMTPTKHEGSSMMIMWALPKNDCQPKRPGEYAEEIKGYAVRIPTSNMSKDDWDDCLMDNLVDPTEGGQPKKLNISLGYSPENPMNDPTGDNTGDVIVADATIDNAGQETSQLLYQWKVEIDNSYNFNNGKTICNDNSCVFDDVTNVKGINIPSFSFKLNLNKNEDSLLGETDYNKYFADDDVAYLRVSVIASENFPGGETAQTKTREGKSNVIIKVVSTDKKIGAYQVELDDNGYPTIPSSNPEEICLSSFDKAVCSVTTNEIIGVKIDTDDLNNFSWTLNGKPLICSSKISSQCNDAEQDNVNFFPVTGNSGETYTLTLNANNVLTGKTINLVKTFQVIDPFIKINISAADADKDIVWPKYLGDYIGLDGRPFADESDSVFQTYEGVFPVMNVEFHPDLIKNYIPPENMECEVDGNSVDLTGGTGDDAYNLKVPDTDQKVPGDVFNIECQALFSQPTDIRQALNNIWGISQFESTEKYLSDKVQIEVVAQEEDLGLLKPKKLMAALIQSLPSQFTFLLRIVLTIIVIIVTTAAVFAFIPNTYETKKIY